MKKLGNFFLDEVQTGKQTGLVYEYRTKKATDPQVQKEQNYELKDVKGKEAEDISQGIWEVEPPTDDELIAGIDKNELNHNKKRILMRLKAKKPFFTQGEAGWGKTSIITKLAHQCGRTVITVYLDKCEATDLGGIPVPKKSASGADYEARLLPGWAKIIWDNPDTQFLLFLDEMNQAQPDVMNALMPIVLKNVICGKKFKNFIVGAAGNFEHENDVNQLSAPLLSRFGGIIMWESGDWNDTFKFLRKKWKGKVADKFIDYLAEVTPELFKNPRDVEQFILDLITNIKEDGAEYFDVSDYADELYQITKKPKKDLSRTENDKVLKLAERMYQFVNNIDNEEEEKKSRKTREQVPQNVIEYMKDMIENGYALQGGRKYGISRENVAKVTYKFPAEMVERAIQKLDDDGVKYKFDKDQQWKDAGYEDPLAD